ncbi:MAG: peroxiredoxin-like family protein [Acidimicrobiales bacterium]
MSTLAQQLKEQNDGARTRIPAETLAVMDAATADVASSWDAEAAVKVGDTAPDFTLPDANGDKVNFAGLLETGPVVLAFYRGGWCPYCSTELRALQASLPELRELGATLVAISPQTPDNSLSTAEKLELAFPVLSDVGNTVSRAFGLVFTLPESLRAVYTGFGLDLPAANGDDSFELPVPATYVIDRNGSVTWRFADADYTRRAEPSDILDAVRTL